MDGMLLVAFFFPALVSFNLAISIITFSVSLFVSFGPEIVQAVKHMLDNQYTGEYAGVLTDWLVDIVGRTDDRQPLSSGWSLLVSAVTIWTTLSTYGVGGAMQHGKRGWKFIQPGVGGLRFVFVQIFTWVSFALSVSMPWTTLKDFGWLTVLGAVPDKEQDPASHRGLLVVGSAFGTLANTFVILGLMSFDPKEKVSRENMRQNRQSLEVGKWRWNLFGESEAWWWLFLVLQGTLVVFSWQLAWMMELSSTTKNNIVESLLLMVVSALLAVPVSLTNAIAGKWRHGERNYRLTMPCQGGPIFVLLQAFGWALFGLAFIATLAKLYSTATASDTMISISNAAKLGFVSYLCIVASLFAFDPTKVKNPDGFHNVATTHQVSSEDETEQPKKKNKEVTSDTLRKGLADRLGGQVKSKHGRSTSPVLKAAESLAAEEDESHDDDGEDEDEVEDDEDDEEEEEEDDEEEEEEDDDESVEDDQVDLSNGSTEIWDEMEDENGNVYYFNVQTGATSTAIPVS